jgi:hypothetical protein
VSRGLGGMDICGYCNSNAHEQCKPKIVFYEKTWYCHCKECGNKFDEPEKEQETVDDTRTSVSED